MGHGATAVGERLALVTTLVNLFFDTGQLVEITKSLVSTQNRSVTSGILKVLVSQEV